MARKEVAILEAINANPELYYSQIAAKMGYADGGSKVSECGRKWRIPAKPNHNVRPENPRAPEIRMALAQHPDWTFRKIAKTLGVTYALVITYAWKLGIHRPRGCRKGWKAAAA